MKFDNQMFKDGFLHKKVRLRSLIIDGIVPTLEELQTFQIPDREDDEFEDDPALVAEKRALKTARLLAATQKKKRVVYEKGEAVEVVEVIFLFPLSSSYERENSRRSKVLSTTSTKMAIHCISRRMKQV